MAHKNSRRSTAGQSDAPSEGSQGNIPDFRRELESLDPNFLDKFDSIIRRKNDRIENSGHKYNKARADLERERTTALNDDSAAAAYPTPPEQSPEYASTSATGSGRTREKSGSDSKDSDEPGAIQQVLRSKHRIPLTESPESSMAQRKAFGATQQAIKSKQQIPLTTSTRSPTASAKSSPAKPSPPLTTEQTLLTLKIQIRLLPALLLLKGSSPPQEARLEARTIAQAALDFARDNDAGDALVGRCCFYIGYTYHDPKAAAPSRIAINWFQRATLATEAGYPEGQRAQECLNRYQSFAPDSRPNSSGNWLANRVSGVWNSIWGDKSSDADPAAVSKPRPEPLKTDGVAMPSAAGGERIPSFDSADSASPSSASTTTRDHYGLKWSPNHPYGKGIGPFLSPEPIYEASEGEEEEEEQYIPANVLGGLVEAGNLSLAMQRSPRRPVMARRSSPRSYIPNNTTNSDEPPTRKVLYVTNPSNPSTEYSFSNPRTREPPGEDKDKDISPTRRLSSYFPFPSARKHSRTQSAVTPPTELVIPPSYSHSEPSGSPTDGRLPSRKGRNSLSLIIKATGLDVYRKRDEATQMEEGESPFKPRMEEEDLYRRRSSDVGDTW